jgi:hypothetical protein
MALNGEVVSVTDTYKGELYLPSPRPMVCRVEYVRTELESKPGIPYEKGVPDTF